MPTGFISLLSFLLSFVDATGIFLCDLCALLIIVFACSPPIMCLEDFPVAEIRVTTVILLFVSPTHLSIFKYILF